MAPYHNLPELLKPIHPPHHYPNHHKHDGHNHPHPRPSPKTTSIGMALLSIYITLLVSMALFTMWRLRNKHARMEDAGFLSGHTNMGAVLSRGDDLGFQTYGFGAGGTQGRGLMKGMTKSRETTQRMASGSRILNTHLSHEDIEDTEETTLLPQSPDIEEAEDAGEEDRRVTSRHINQRDDGTGNGWNYWFSGSRFGMGNWFLREPKPDTDLGRRSDGRDGGGSNVAVPEGLRIAAEREEGIFA